MARAKKSKSKLSELEGQPDPRAVLDRTLEPAIQRFGLDDAMCTEELGRCSPVKISPHFFLEPSRV